MLCGLVLCCVPCAVLCGVELCCNVSYCAVSAVDAVVIRVVLSVLCCAAWR